jgi:hypothetical protein
LEAQIFIRFLFGQDDLGVCDFRGRDTAKSLGNFGQKNRITPDAFGRAVDPDSTPDAMDTEITNKILGICVAAKKLGIFGLY